MALYTRSRLESKIKRSKTICTTRLGHNTLLSFSQRYVAPLLLSEKLSELPKGLPRDNAVGWGGPHGAYCHEWLWQS